MLFLKITPDYDTTAELIKAHAKLMYGIDTEMHTYTTREEFQTFLADKYHDRYDYLYIGSHGNEEGIAKSSNGEDFIRWADLAMDICVNPGLNKKSVLFLGCCKGGVSQGALVMMANCDTIYHICGSECDIDSREACLSLLTFIQHHEKGTEARRIEESVSKAVDRGFSIYSRYEMVMDIADVKERMLSQNRYLPDEFYPTQHVEDSPPPHLAESTPTNVQTQTITIVPSNTAETVEAAS